MDMNYTNKLANNYDCSHGHGDLDHDHDHIAMEDPILHHHHHLHCPQISYVHHPDWPNFPLHQMPSSSTHHHHQQVFRPSITSHVQFGGDEDQVQEVELVGSTNDNHNFMELEDKEADEEEDEQLGAMKEMMYKMAVMQPVDIDPATIRKPKRRNVRISDDPQSVAARHRRERISEKIRILQRLVPGGTKMDTASMLDEAIRYLKFLKRQIRLLQSSNHNPHHQPQLLDWLSPITSNIITPNHHHYHGSTTAAATSSSTDDIPTTRQAAGFAFGGDIAASSCFGLQS